MILRPNDETEKRSTVTSSCEKHSNYFIILVVVLLVMLFILFIYSVYLFCYLWYLFWCLSGSIPIHCPIRLIHGLSDDQVPSSLALQLMDNCVTDDAAITLLKSSNHDMEAPSDMTTMRTMILEVIIHNVEIKTKRQIIFPFS